MDSASLSLGLTPHGRLALIPDDDAAPLGPEFRERLQQAFHRGSGHGLLLLGADEAGAALPPVVSYWREFGTRYVTALCTQQNDDASHRKGHVAVLRNEELEGTVSAAPPMSGGEYLTAAVLRSLWLELDRAFAIELSKSKCDVQEFLKRRNPAWNLVGRVHFNLAENRKEPETPFAFLATYTTRLSARDKAQHLPLAQALREYAGGANKNRLLSLLVPVQRASETCPWLKAMVDAGEIFHPLRWTPDEALQLLQDVPRLEAAGVVVRMPAVWRGNRPPRPRVTGAVGGKPPTGLGQDALLDFHTEVTLDGDPLTAAEIADLLAKSDGLALVRGRWIELDRQQLKRMLERFQEVERTASENGLAFGEAMRLLAGANLAAGNEEASAGAESWSGSAGGTPACSHHRTRSSFLAVARTGRICASTWRRCFMALARASTSSPNSSSCCAEWTRRICSSRRANRFRLSNGSRPEPKF
jgi:non-specific serine/threonine protein kinase